MYRRSEIGKTSRALLVIEALRGMRYGVAITDLASDLGVHEKTIKRDLDELASSSYEIERFTRESDGRLMARLVDRDYKDIPFNRRERYALLAMRSVFDVLRGTPLWDDIDGIMRKVEERMTDAERAEHDAYGDRIAYIPDGGVKVHAGDKESLDYLWLGMLLRKVVAFEYQEARGRVQRGCLAPLGMVVYKNGLYVFGRRIEKPDDGKTIDIDPGSHESIVRLAVERFTDVELHRLCGFNLPPGFRLADLVRSGFDLYPATKRSYEVVIEFSKKVAAYVRARVYHDEQRLDELPDGRLRLSFPSRNLTPIVSWVLEWGPQARVVGPPELVAQVVAELDAARKLYDPA
jgi:predicted DNA-binding transcriptional regulator YafY